MIFPKLQTNRLQLRPLKKKDIFNHTELFSDKETMELFGGKMLDNILKINDLIQDNTREFDAGYSIFWAITLKEEKEFIGFVRLMSYDSYYFDASYSFLGNQKYNQKFLSYIDKDNGWEMDYALLKTYRNKGIMSEATKSVISFCKETNKLPLYAKVNNLKNIATVSILKKINFQELIPQVTKSNEYGMIYKLAD